MLVSAAESPAAGADEPGSGPVWNYLATLDRRDRFIASWERYFTSCDAFIAPAMPMHAWRVDHGEWRVDTGQPADDSPQAQAFVALLLSQVSGCPMVVIPVGIDTNGVPFGIQVLGRRRCDEQLLDIAEEITTITGGFRPPPGV